MNIAIDFGNSSIKVGVFENDNLIKQYKDVPNVQLLNLVNEDINCKIILSSVNDSFTHLINLFENKDRITILNYKTPLPISNLYASPETLGSDRLAVAVGASFVFPANNCLIVDAGTCITYDFIDSQNCYHGGSISPGIEMRYKSMHVLTSKLPLIISKQLPEAFIGNNTSLSMQSGVLNGVLGEFIYLVSLYKGMYNDLKIVVCGGDAAFFETRIKEPIFAIPELVLMGLNRILNYNAENS